MDRRVQKVLALLEDNLQRELSIKKVARLVNLSSSRLRHLFKAETSMTPAQYLKRLRMQKAKELSEITSLNVKQIMAAVGITDESHFVRDFKKAYGLSPSQYRACINGDQLIAQDGAEPNSQIG